MTAMDEKLANGMTNQAVRKIRKNNQDNTKSILKIYKEIAKIYRKNNSGGYFSAICTKMANEFSEEFLLNCAIFKTRMSKDRLFQVTTLAINPTRYITGNGHENVEDCLGINNYRIEMKKLSVSAGLIIMPVVIIRHALKRLLENGAMPDLEPKSLSDLARRTSVFAHIQKICRSKKDIIADIVIPVGDIKNPSGVLVGRISPVRFEIQNIENLSDDENGIVMATYVPIGDLPQFRIDAVKAFCRYISSFSDEKITEMIIQISSDTELDPKIVDEFVHIQDMLTQSFRSWSRMPGSYISEFEDIPCESDINSAMSL